MEQLTPQDFGADGNGATDDTVAFQKFVDRLTRTGGKGHGTVGYLPPDSHYLLGAPVVFPGRPGWAVRGAHRDSVRVTQCADNVPIFDLAGSKGSYLHTYELEGITFGYANHQPPENTGANCIVMSEEIFQGTWRNLKFSNGHYANTVRDGIGAPWGHTFDDITFDQGLTGGAFDWRRSINGIPNNRFGRLFVDARRMTKTILDIRTYNSTIDTVEVIAANEGAPLLRLAAGTKVNVGSIKVENGVYRDPVNLITVDPNSYANIGHVNVSGHSMDFDHAGTSYAVLVAGGSRLDLGMLTVEPAQVGPGKLFAFGGGGNVDVNRVHLTDKVDGLLNNGSSEQAHSTTVREYANTNAARATGAALDLGLGSPTTTVFREPLTEPATIQLPDSNDNLFNGLTYTLVFNGAINGDNTATITCEGQELHVQATDKTAIGFTYLRHPFSAARGWCLTSCQTLP